MKIKRLLANIAGNVLGTGMLSLVFLLGTGTITGVNAGEVIVAVANNFHTPLKTIAEDFEADTGHDVSISTGSTGQLYAQISNGAPFDVFLAADQKRPAKLVESGFAEKRFTYAEGQLVLWSPKVDLFKDGKKALVKEDVKHIAIAIPKLAPYGKAAEQVMKNIGVYPLVKSKLVMGKGLNAIYQFAVTGNAEVAFLAKSQVYRNGEYTPGSLWVIPDDLYTSIKQDAVLLNKGLDNSAAQDFVHYLSSEKAKKRIAEFGYN